MMSVIMRCIMRGMMIIVAVRRVVRVMSVMISVRVRAMRCVIMTIAIVQRMALPNQGAPRPWLQQQGTQTMRDSLISPKQLGVHL